MNTLIEQAEMLFTQLDSLPLDERIDTLNELKKRLHAHSPFVSEPVDCVLWIKGDQVEANDYNPNAVAPPEMKLLERSIDEDGYTQPIVSWNSHEDRYEVVDGFHRTEVGKKSTKIASRVHGYLPLSVINTNRTERTDRMASTIRHNRARGSHEIDLMSHIVAEIHQLGRSDQWIAKHLGMDVDEILRLKQITGLAEAFKHHEFGKAWEEIEL